MPDTDQVTLKHPNLGDERVTVTPAQAHVLGKSGWEPADERAVPASTTTTSSWAVDDEEV